MFYRNIHSAAATAAATEEQRLAAERLASEELSVYKRHLAAVNAYYSHPKPEAPLEAPLKEKTHTFTGGVCKFYYQPVLDHSSLVIGGHVIGGHVKEHSDGQRYRGGYVVDSAGVRHPCVEIVQDVWFYTAPRK